MLDKAPKKLPDFEKVAQLGLVIGNEAHGVSDFIANLSDAKLYIPIFGQAESLNAAVCCRYYDLSFCVRRFACLVSSLFIIKSKLKITIIFGRYYLWLKKVKKRASKIVAKTS